MAEKAMAYDNPAYQAVMFVPLYSGTGTTTFSSCMFPFITGNAGTSNKFAAFTNMLVKSITLAAATVGTSTTSSNLPILYRITNNGTTAVNTCTVTYTLTGTGVPGPAGTAVTTAAYVVKAWAGTNTTTTNATANAIYTNGEIPLLPGDEVYVAKGTDATESLQVTMELRIQPGASVTV